jgi:hypothetical protein
MAINGNGTYHLAELNRARIVVPVAGKRITAFKKRHEDSPDLGSEESDDGGDGTVSRCCANARKRGGTTGVLTRERRVMEGGRIKQRGRDERGQDAQQVCYITIRMYNSGGRLGRTTNPKTLPETLTYQGRRRIRTKRNPRWYARSHPKLATPLQWHPSSPFIIQGGRGRMS